MRKRSRYDDDFGPGWNIQRVWNDIKVEEHLREKWKRQFKVKPDKKGREWEQPNF